MAELAGKMLRHSLFGSFRPVVDLCRQYKRAAEDMQTAVKETLAKASADGRGQEATPQQLVHDGWGYGLDGDLFPLQAVLGHILYLGWGPDDIAHKCHMVH